MVVDLMRLNFQHYPFLADLGPHELDLLRCLVHPFTIQRQVLKLEPVTPLAHRLDQVVVVAQLLNPEPKCFARLTWLINAQHFLLLALKLDWQHRRRNNPIELRMHLGFKKRQKFLRHYVLADHLIAALI